MLFETDVDVPSPDEKSVITYVSSIYDAFPKIPEGGEGIVVNVGLNLLHPLCHLNTHNTHTSNNQFQVQFHFLCPLFSVTRTWTNIGHSTSPGSPLCSSGVTSIRPSWPTKPFHKTLLNSR